MKLKIERRAFEKENLFGENYSIRFSLIDTPNYFNESIFVFNKFVDSNYRWLDIEKVNDVDFLKSNNIDFILEKEQIIPIGFIDFTSQETDSNSFRLLATNENNLFKYNQIIKNFIRAIEIKYETIKFKDSFTPTSNTSYDNIEIIEFSKIETLAT